ncbi:hypothetical protein F2P81_013684 [Scophthalmus maximus]|uniref:Uncharacterized protein n=1 Tax=Scophthalmus maximus TaxID=52904 RepID=A0A6A4SN32_SCOMX|nr:hypothetical protein F2P81_013684 [Scophthalmus maximus]
MCHPFCLFQDPRKQKDFHLDAHLLAVKLHRIRSSAKDTNVKGKDMLNKRAIQRSDIPSQQPPGNSDKKEKKKMTFGEGGSLSVLVLQTHEYTENTTRDQSLHTHKYSQIHRSMDVNRLCRLLSNTLDKQPTSAHTNIYFGHFWGHHPPGLRRRRTVPESSQDELLSERRLLMAAAAAAADVVRLGGDEEKWGVDAAPCASDRGVQHTQCGRLLMRP